AGDLIGDDPDPDARPGDVADDVRGTAAAARLDGVHAERGLAPDRLVGELRPAHERRAVDEARLAAELGVRHRKAADLGALLLVDRPDAIVDTLDRDAPLIVLKRGEHL